jgi:hypothetical protein
MRLIHRALNRAEPHRSKFYGKWIRNQWDAPSILSSISEIRAIVGHIDATAVINSVSDHVIQLFVVRQRGPKSVCAHVRALAHNILLNPLANEHPLMSAHLATEAVHVGAVYEEKHMSGTDASQVRRPRRLWVLVFNTTIDARYTTQPWVAVSHS